MPKNVPSLKTRKLQISEHSTRTDRQCLEAGLAGIVNTPSSRCVWRASNRGEQVERYPSSLLSLDEIQQKGRGYRSREVWPGSRSILGLVLPETYGYLDDEVCDPLDQDDDNGHLGQDCGPVDPADLWFGEDTEVVFGRGIGPLGSGWEGLQLLMSIRPPADLGYQPVKAKDAAKKWVDRLKAAAQGAMPARVSPC